MAKKAKEDVVTEEVVIDEDVVIDEEEEVTPTRIYPIDDLEYKGSDVGEYLLFHGRSRSLSVLKRLSELEGVLEFDNSPGKRRELLTALRGF